MLYRLFLLTMVVSAVALVSGCDSRSSSDATQAETSAAEETTDIPAVLEIARGNKVEIAEHAVKGMYTLFDFYSEYCPPCVAVKPKVEELAKTNPEIVLRIVNINREGVRGIDWGSPVAQQYNLGSIPHFKVFDKEGNLMLEDRAAFDWYLKEYQKIASD